MQYYHWKKLDSRYAENINIKFIIPRQSDQRLFFLDEFSPLGNKKWAGESNKGKIGNFTKNIRHILRRKKARSRQIYTVCYCMVARTRLDSKKDLLVQRDTGHLLLITAEDPSQLEEFWKKNTLNRIRLGLD